MSGVTFDRRVSREFLSLFNGTAPDGGPAASLVTYANEALFPVDFRFRKSTTGLEHATLYVGLTAVLNVRRRAKGLISLDVYPTHAKAGKFTAAWSKPMTEAALSSIWPEVELYLDRIIPIATLSHGRKEGAVQAAVVSHRPAGRIIIDREVTPSFSTKAEKQGFLEECQAPILTALRQAKLGFGGAPTRLGNECDALGVDDKGRVLAIEVKPLSGGTIAWVAAQAMMYARILQRWVDLSENPDAKPVDVIKGMLDQRRQIGLASQPLEVSEPLQVIPVIALQRGASPEMVRRMLAVRGVLMSADLGVPPPVVFEVNLLGEMLPLDESRMPDGRPRPRVSYVQVANRALAQWKASTSVLPEEARAPGMVPSRGGEQVAVDYALPRTHAEHNLLPEVRQSALRLFEALKISWHQGSGGKPTAHLRSSQVQCVNALGQMMADPGRIEAAFGSVLDIAEVRDFGTVDPQDSGRYLTFEFIGPKDYFGEGRRGTRSRGAQSTSVDAAFAFVNRGGAGELALVEWKFTETYPASDNKAAAKEAERRRRYEKALTASDSPIDIEGIELADLFHEPIYQLVRQQLLAHELERDPAIAAEVVRVVHVLSPRNNAYARSYLAPGLRHLGSTPADVWRRLLRRPDRFVSVDPAVFLNPDITSQEYCARYAIPDS